MLDDNIYAQIELHCLHLRGEHAVSSTMLSTVEKQRAGAFRSGEAARLFVAGRMLCRTVLGKIVSCDPHVLAVAVSAEGRPYLEDYPAIDFNLSHTANAVALAVSRGGRIGIDIQQPWELDEAEMRDLMPLVLSDEESADLHKLAPAHRLAEFFAVWVRKEAVLKCRGRGLLDCPKGVATGFPNATQDMHDEMGVSSGKSRLHQGRERGYLWAVATDNPVKMPTWQHHHNDTIL